MNHKNLYIPTDIFIDEPAEVYHGKAREYLSSHQLIDFMKCPLLYNKKQTGEIQDQETTSFMVGQAAHVRILKGRDVYLQRYAVGGPINPTTGKPYGSLTKKFAEWREKQSKPVLTVEQAELVEQMARGVALNDAAVDLITYGLAEGVIRAVYCGVPCQIRLDWLNPNRGIVDFKTCDELTWFEADARRYRYHNQVAFYQAVLEKAIREGACEVSRIQQSDHQIESVRAAAHIPVHLIAIEKKEPFRCGVWRVSDECLAMARQDNEEAIDRLKVCRTRDIWPTGYEEIRLLEVA
jgi:hypothetical protein